MMFVETNAVVPEAVHLFPGIEMFGVGANCHVCLEVTARQRIGQLAADLEMTKLFAVSKQIEDENFHVCLPKVSILRIGGIRGQSTGLSPKGGSRLGG